jgi:gliding motility-associated-like protein
VLASFPDAGPGVNPTLQITFPGPGNYSVTLVIDNDCPADPESFTEQITIPVALPPFTLQDTSVCANATVRLEVYPGSAGPAGVTYSWRLPNGTKRAGKAINVTVADITASSSVFQAVVSNEGCSQQAGVRVNFIRIPINLGNDTTLCQASTLLLNAGNPGMQYQWRENGLLRPETTQTISLRPGPGTTTTIAVTVTDPLTNCSDTDQIVIRRGAAPEVTVTPTPVTGCGLVDGRLAIRFVSPGPNLFSVVRQSDGAPLISNEQTSGSLRDFTGLAAGGYRVTVRNTTSGCDTTIVATIGTNDPNAPQITIAPATVSCNNPRGTATITAAFTPVTGRSYTYEWRDTANVVVGSSPNLTSRPGVYSVKVTDDLNCVSAATGQIRVNPDNPLVTVSQIQNSCGQFLLRAVLSGPDANPARFRFIWNGPGVNVDQVGRDTITVSGPASQTINYTVSIANVPRDPNNDPVCQGTPVNIPVVYSDIPEFDYPGNAGPACEGESILLNAPENPYWDTYIWTLPGGARFSGRQYSARVGGRYRITVRNSRTGCERSDDVEVTINPRPAAPQLQNPAPLCAGGSIPQLSATGQNLRWYADPALTRQLSQGPSTPAFLPPVNNTITGTYIYYVTQTVNGCESLPTAATLVIAPSGQVNLGPDRTVCQGETVVLNATSQIPNATYRWSNGQTGPVLNATRSGTYGVTVTLGTCSVTDEVTLTFVAAPLTNIPRKEVPLCRADGQPNAVLDAGPGANFTYEWRALGSAAILGTNRTLTVANLGRYTIAISNGSACIFTDTITVADKCEPRVFVPDAFTPNSDRDAVNSTLEVKGNYVGRIEMMVYNRWGELIHENRAANLEDLNRRAWDGNFLGRPAPTGTYVWKITYRSQYYPEREPITIRGGVLLLR